MNSKNYKKNLIWSLLLLFVLSYVAYPVNRADAPHVKGKIVRPIENFIILDPAVRSNIHPGEKITTLRKQNHCVSRKEKNWYVIKLEAPVDIYWSDPDYDPDREPHNSNRPYLDATHKRGDGREIKGTGYSWSVESSSGDAGEIIELNHSDDPNAPVLTLKSETDKKWRTCWYKPPELSKADLSTEIQKQKVTIKLKVNDEGSPEDDAEVEADDIDVYVHKDFLSMYFELFDGKDCKPTELNNEKIDNPVINCHRSTIMMATGNIGISSKNYYRKEVEELLNTDFTNIGSIDYYYNFLVYLNSSTTSITTLKNQIKSDLNSIGLQRGDVIKYKTKDIPNATVRHTHTVIRHSGNIYKSFGANNEPPDWKDNSYIDPSSVQGTGKPHYTFTWSWIWGITIDESWKWSEDNVENYMADSWEKLSQYMSSPTKFIPPGSTGHPIITGSSAYADIFRKL